MLELEKIFKEIDAYSLEFVMFGGKSDAYISSKWVKDIIRKHMNGKDADVAINDGWIPVEDRLPEGRTRVICQFDNGDIELLWQDWESDTESLTYWTDFDFMAEKKVIAWRPLPDPYQIERRR